MKVATFDEDLLGGLEDFAHRLESFIAIEREFVDGSLVVGLNSPFGSGKSTFLEMWRYSLEHRQEKGEKAFLVLLNAWEGDFYGDPLFAIVSALVDRVQKEGGSAEKIINAAKDLGWFTTAIGGQIVKKVTGVDLGAAGKHAKKKKKIRNDKKQLVPDIFSIYEGRKKAMLLLKKAIQEFAEDTESNILFLVDELDRCRPDYAISYLETIKHIFDVKGAVFLIAADRKHLENSAKTAFGIDLNFDEYYRKFIHREVVLPVVSDTNYKKMVSKYVNYYLEGGGSRNCFMKVDPDRVDKITELAGAHNLTPRQLQEVFRTLGHLLETSEENKGRLLWAWASGTIMMSVLRIGEPDIYHLLGRQQIKPKEVYDYFRDLLGQHVDSWFYLCLTGGGLNVKENDKLVDIIRDVGLLEVDQKNDQERLAQWSGGWGHSGRSAIKEIYEKIEQLHQWD